MGNGAWEELKVQFIGVGIGRGHWKGMARDKTGKKPKG